MKIILLSAKAQHGKSSLGNYLKEKLESQGKTVIIDRFAKYIKSYAKQLGWDGVTKDEYWRNFLQKTGTDIIKEKLNMKCFHAKRLAEDIQILSETGEIDYFIIDDCRFKDELYYIKSMFPNETIDVRVVRVGFESNLTKEQKLHKSETDLDDFKFSYNIYVQNGLQHLYDETDRVLGKVLGYKNNNQKCKHIRENGLSAIEYDDKNEMRNSDMYCTVCGKCGSRKELEGDILV